jgi:exodeoxyribonuclease VII large subunit
MRSLNIGELSQCIKDNLPKQKIILTAEVKQPKISNGNMYLELKDKSGCISAAIFKFNMTEDMENIQEGDEITVKGNLNYYQERGRLNFVIRDLVSVQGSGQLHKQYIQIKNQFEKKGYFLPQNKLPLPKTIQNILILTSASGAAVKDFYYGLDNGKGRINHKLIDVIVQGTDCPSNICHILTTDNNKLEQYDLIVITRGGGSFEDLFGFCQPELIECVHNLKVPVLSAIGHQVDTTLLDHVADIVAPTPSLAAQFIIDHNRTYVDTLLYKKKRLFSLLQKPMINKNSELDSYKNTILNQKNIFINYKIHLFNRINMAINKELLNLEKLSNKYTIPDAQSGVHLLSKDKVISDNNMLVKQVKRKIPLTIQWGDTLLTLTDYQFTLH